MAISDPLAAADFWELLSFAGRPEFVSQQYRKQSMDGAGNARSASLGSPKWIVTVVLEGGWHSRNLPQEADLKRLEGMDKSFLAYDIRRPYPAADPDGWRIGETVAHIKTKGANNHSIALEDLPGHFTVTKGDKLSVLYQSTKYFLCEAMETMTADSSGDTGEFEIWPFMPAGIAVADAVTLIKPCGKFKIVAGSYRSSSGQGNFGGGASFSMISGP
jgi:hypothetical protein